MTSIKPIVVDLESGPGKVWRIEYQNDGAIAIHWKSRQKPWGKLRTIVDSIDGFEPFNPSKDALKKDNGLYESYVYLKRDEDEKELFAEPRATIKALIDKMAAVKPEPLITSPDVEEIYSAFEIDTELATAETGDHAKNHKPLGHGARKPEKRER